MAKLLHARHQLLRQRFAPARASHHSAPLAQSSGKKFVGKGVDKLIGHKKKARPKNDLAFWARWPTINCRAAESIFRPFGAGAGATSLCCAQAPNPNAVTKRATTMILFKNFNLSRLLSLAGCSGLFRQGSKAEAMLFFTFLSRHELAAWPILSSRLSPRLW